MKSRNTIVKYVLVVGCGHSGTSLLASMIGRHPDINMSFENLQHDSEMIGKDYNGNKLILYSQIRRNQKATRIGFLINRIVNLDFFGKKYHKLRPFPISRRSITDYLGVDARIIYIIRNRNDNVKSLMNRNNFSLKQATDRFDKSIKVMNGINSFTVEYEKLVENPGKILKLICIYLGISNSKRMLEGDKYNFLYLEKSK